MGESHSLETHVELALRSRARWKLTVVHSALHGHGGSPGPRTLRNEQIKMLSSHPHIPALASPRNELCLQHPLPAAIGREGPSASEPHISVPLGCGDHEYFGPPHSKPKKLLLHPEAPGERLCGLVPKRRPSCRDCLRTLGLPRGLGCCCFSVFASCGPVLSQRPLSRRGPGSPSPLGYHLASASL